MPAFHSSMKHLGKVALPLLAIATVACGLVSKSGDQTVGTITYSVSGGIAGWQRTLTIDQEGKAHVQVVRGPSPGTTDKQVDPAVLQRLHELVSDPAFVALQRQYLPSPGGADLQDYEVTVEVDGKTIKTMTRDGAAPPQILRDVLNILNEILRAA